MTIEEYKTRNTLDQFYRSRGFKLAGSGRKLVSNRCPYQEHDSKHLCVSIDLDKKLWHCNDCDCGGDIFTWIAFEKHMSNGDVLKSLAIDNPSSKWKPIPETHTKPEPNHTIAKEYTYRNALGDEVFQVVRLVPKSFRQRHKDATGNWVWGMDGIERVLYRLPEVLKSNTVGLAEGEKDADTLTSLGICGTCNVGGAGKWLEGYTETLAGKEVIIFGDNDEAGKKHTKLVFDSIAGKAKCVRIVKVPEPFKDITEYVESFAELNEAKAVVNDLVDSSHPFYNGVAMPLYTMADIEARYEKYSRQKETESFSLGKWLPSLGRIRNLMPGEVVLFVGDTGAGKTAILQCLALKALPLPTLLFEIELPAELLFERFVAIQTKLAAREVESTYASGDSLGKKALDYHFKNLFICDDPNLSVAKMEAIITRSELKMGMKPKLVLLDYVQLLRSEGESRYDRASNAAENLKRIAKATGTIIVAASQRSRPREGEVEIGLHDAKESGSLENSAGLVIGAWRDPNDPMTMKLRVLKSTKGGAGLEVACNFRGDTLTIDEKAKIDPKDLPPRRQTHPD